MEGALVRVPKKLPLREMGVVHTFSTHSTSLSLTAIVGVERAYTGREGDNEKARGYTRVPS